MARIPPSNTELDPLINSYEHESQRSRADQALFTLRKIGSVVKPIMRRRSWRVGVLAEFYPAETNLLGLNTNRGQKINVRLRYPGDANQFLPFEEVVDTMLHELCHNEIGPHNADFHALWDQLRDEHEALVRKGYTGEGFLGSGNRLGGRRVPLAEARRLARQAAEQRKILATGSGQRLGGTGILRGQDARAVIAAAVERRLRIERGCASGTATGEKVARGEEVKKEKVTTTVAGPEDESETNMMQAFIDLIQEEERAKFGGYYEPPSSSNPVGSRGRSSNSTSTLTPDNKGKEKQREKSSLVAEQRQIEQEIERQKREQQRQKERLFSKGPDFKKQKRAGNNTPIPTPTPTSTSPSTSNGGGGGGGGDGFKNNHPFSRTTPFIPATSAAQDDRSRTVSPAPAPAPASTATFSSALGTRGNGSNSASGTGGGGNTYTNPIATTAAAVPDTWTCEVCTLVNPIDFLVCDACTVERPEWVSQVQEQLPPPHGVARSGSLTVSSVSNAGTGTGTRIGTGTGTATGTGTTTGKGKPSAYESLSRFEAERASKIASRPVGWHCVNCNNFMENEWWTCSVCGVMKGSS